MIWFTSDTHYGHAKAIEFCNRPFATVDEMNASMAERHNSRVKPDDTVYHLGDVMWSTKRDRWTDLFDQLNGRFRLIRGNHDIVLRKTGWTHPKVELITDYAEEKIDGIKVVLFHYPIGAWNGAAKGSFHLHGHGHGAWPASDPRSRQHGRAMDVGVDVSSWFPVSWDLVRHVLNGIEPRDGRIRS